MEVDLEVLGQDNIPGESEHVFKPSATKVPMPRQLGDEETTESLQHWKVTLIILDEMIISMSFYHLTSLGTLWLQIMVCKMKQQV